MYPTDTDTLTHTTSSEIEKPNRAQGRAEEMRQMLFLAHFGRPAQSGRRLPKDEKTNNEQTISLLSLDKQLQPVDASNQQRHFFAHHTH